MTEFEEHIKKHVNETFQKSQIPLKINHIILFRPVFHESPFENLEIINSSKRFISCNCVHMQITMSHGNYDFEVELRYVNKNGRFTNEWCRILFCDIFPDEDPETIQDRLSEYAKLTGMIVLMALDELP
ncbi:MAG: hypothetical protein WC325_03500 [Candidatus Bathyarchaeia archaeon]